MSKKCGCPLCTVEEDTENDEAERILGAAMMEPDVRIATNSKGFCNRHLKELMSRPNRLSLALMLSTHMAQFTKDIYSGCTPLLQKVPDGKKQYSALDKKRTECYLCNRINGFMSAALDAFIYMYKTDSEMSAKIAEQQYFCIKHTRKLFGLAQKSLSKDLYKKFCSDINAVSSKYAEQLIEDLDWFCKKFDYRYKDEDWKNSKDAVERAVKYLNK